MHHAIGNTFIYLVGILLGFMFSRYLYLSAKRKPIAKTRNSVIVGALNTIIIVAGFILGFIAVVIIYTLLYIVFMR